MPRHIGEWVKDIWAICLVVAEPARKHSECLRVQALVLGLR